MSSVFIVFFLSLLLLVTCSCYHHRNRRKIDTIYLFLSFFYTDDMTLKWGKTILSSLSLLIWPSINLSKETKIIVKQSINDKKIYTKKKTIDLLHQRCTVKLAEWFPFIINVIDIISITVNIYMHTFTCWAIEIDRNHLKMICVSIWTNRTDVPWSSWCIIINSRSLDEFFSFLHACFTYWIFCSVKFLFMMFFLLLMYLCVWVYDPIIHYICQSCWIKQPIINICKWNWK